MLSPIWGISTFTAMFVSSRFLDLLSSSGARQAPRGIRDARGIR